MEDNHALSEQQKEVFEGQLTANYKRIEFLKSYTEQLMGDGALSFAAGYLNDLAEAKARYIAFKMSLAILGYGTKEDRDAQTVSVVPDAPWATV